MARAQSYAQKLQAEQLANLDLQILTCGVLVGQDNPHVLSAESVVSPETHTELVAEAAGALALNGWQTIVVHEDPQRMADAIAARPNIQNATERIGIAQLANCYNPSQRRSAVSAFNQGDIRIAVGSTRWRGMVGLRPTAVVFGQPLYTKRLMQEMLEGLGYPSKLVEIYPIPATPERSTRATITMWDVLGKTVITQSRNGGDAEVRPSRLKAAIFPPPLKERFDACDNQPVLSLVCPPRPRSQAPPPAIKPSRYTPPPQEVGDIGLGELAKRLGLTPGFARKQLQGVVEAPVLKLLNGKNVACIRRADVETARALLERTLPLHLIPLKAIADRLNCNDQAVLTALEGFPREKRLLPGRGGEMLHFNWAALQHLEEQGVGRLSGTAVPIVWDKLPDGRREPTIRQETYARALHILLVDPKRLPLQSASMTAEAALDVILSAYENATQPWRKPALMELESPAEPGEPTGDVVAAYLKAVRTIPLLQAEQEVELAQKIEAGLFAKHKIERGANDIELLIIAREGKAAKERFIEANLRMVLWIAKQYIHKGVPLLDLIQAGNLGLVRAVEKFDFTKGLKFSGYAVRWIRSFISRSITLDRTIHLPVNMSREIASMLNTQAELATSLGRPPTHQELAQSLGIEIKELVLWKEAAQTPTAMDVPVGEDQDMALGDTIADLDAMDPVKSAEFSGLRDDIRQVLGTLSEREADIIRWRFGLMDGTEYSLTQIGKKYGLSSMRISQIEKAVLNKLRELHAERLRPYME